MAKILNLKKIKDKIWDWEMKSNGFYKLADVDVSVSNVRVVKSEKKVFATIKINRYTDYVTERHENCEYGFEILGL